MASSARDGPSRRCLLFASETCAFDTVGATYVRDVQPGEMLSYWIATGFRADRFDRGASVRFVRWNISTSPGLTVILTRMNIHSARKRMGKRLAMEAFVDADVVTGVPDSSISAAIGFAEQTGIPYELG